MKHQSVLYGSALWGYASAAIHHVVLQPIPFEQQLKHASIENHVQVLSQKYMSSGQPLSPEKFFRDTLIPLHGGHNVPVENFLNTYYLAQIKIGTHGQTFKVVLDTGSSNLWLHSRRCYSINSSFDIVTGGCISQDTVQIGDIVIQHQEFREMNETLTSNHFDGLFGLGYNTLSVGSAKPPIYNMIDQKLIDEPVFAFYLGDNNRKEKDSVVTFGGIDKSHYISDISWIPVRRKAYWEVQLDAITFGDQTAKLECTGAIFDTGTSLLVLPSTLAELLNKEIDASRGAGDRYTVDCEKRKTMPDLTFTMCGSNFTVTAEDYILHVNGSCISAFVGLDIPEPTGPVAILGDAFLRKWYSVYDLGNNAIGLAEAA